MSLGGLLTFEGKGGVDLGEKGGSGRELEGMEGEETAVGMYFMREKKICLFQLT